MTFPSETLSIPILKLRPDAILPQYAHGPEEDAGMDLHSVTEIDLAPGAVCLCATGIAIELPPYYEMQIRPRGGWALKYAVTVLNAPGTVDAGFRGEIGVILINHGQKVVSIHKGDRIAQGVVTRYVPVCWEEVQRLSDSQRGSGMLASTGFTSSILRPGNDIGVREKVRRSGYKDRSRSKQDASLDRETLL